MKTNPLEDFIRSNREALDQTDPPTDLFDRIQEQLPAPVPQQQPRVIHLGLRQVAAAAAVILMAFLAGMGISGWQQQQIQARATRIQPDFAEAEQYYRIQVRQRIRQLETTAGNNEAVLSDIRQLDQLMEELRHELSQAPVGAEEQIVANLIQTYKIKIDILEKVLEHRASHKQPLIKTHSHEQEL
jgi:uncharacterized protein HemX